METCPDPWLAMEYARKLVAIDNLQAEMDDGVSPECSGYAAKIRAILGEFGGHDQENEQ